MCKYLLQNLAETSSKLENLRSKFSDSNEIMGRASEESTGNEEKPTNQIGRKGGASKHLTEGQEFSPDKSSEENDKKPRAQPEENNSFTDSETSKRINTEVESVEVRNFLLIRSSFIIPKDSEKAVNNVTSFYNSICFTSVGQAAKTMYTRREKVRT